MLFRRIRGHPKRSSGRMLTSKNVLWPSKLLVLFAATLIAANAQCAMTCSFEQWGSSETPSHCHHHNMPDKEKPASPPCSHEISIVSASGKTFAAAPAQLLLADPTVLFVATILEPASYSSVVNDVSPPVPPHLSISVLRI